MLLIGDSPPEKMFSGILSNKSNKIHSLLPQLNTFKCTMDIFVSPAKHGRHIGIVTLATSST